MPGVSISRSCASGSLRMPRIRRRVVCGRDVTIATLWPTIRLSSVDLPTLERPPSTTKPARCSGGAVTVVLFDSIQCLAGRGLLALLLAAAGAATEIAPSDANAGSETFRMVGAFGGNQFVNGLRAKATICDFLKLGLVIAFGRGSADVTLEQKLNDMLRGSDAAVGVDGSDYRFEGRRKDRYLLPSATLLFALAKPQRLA